MGALSNLKRYFFKRIIIGNQGKIVETDEKIICYVKKEKVIYKLVVFCRDSINLKIIKNRSLNKPICYVFENINFWNKHIIDISGDENCDLIFKNCTFSGRGIRIFTGGNCTFENTTLGYTGLGSSTYSYVRAKNIFINGLHTDGNYYPKTIDFCTNGKNGLIDISNSNIFASDKLTFSSANIKIDQSSSIESVSINLRTKNFTPINVKGCDIVLNGAKIDGEGKTFILKMTNDQLSIVRAELVNTLENIRNKIEKDNNVEISEYKRECYNRPICKKLKKYR